MSSEARSVGALKTESKEPCVLIYVRFDLVSSTFLKTGGRKKLQRVGKNMKPGVKSLKVG